MQVKDLDDIPNSMGGCPEIKPRARLERRQRLSKALSGAKPCISRVDVHHVELPFVRHLGMRRKGIPTCVCALNLEDTRHRTHAETRKHVTCEGQHDH